MKPSKLINAVLDGTLAMEKAPLAIQSCIRWPIYEKAVEILALPHAARKPAIEDAPAALRPYLEAEIIRIWRLRNGEAK